MTAKKQNGTSVVGYKQKLLAARELRARTGGLVFDRMALLIQVFEDRDFRADLGNVDDFKAAEALDREVEDLGFEFLQLRAMAAHFPARETWEKGVLATMYAEMLEARATPKPCEEPKRTRRVISQAEYQEVVEEATKAKAQVKQLREYKSEVDQLRDENAELKRQIVELERENADLRRQLTESVAVLA